MTKLPDGLETDNPFDLKKFFQTVPRDQNAAPLYLDAFFEFNDEMATCFPPGEATEKRRQVAQVRHKRYYDLAQKMASDSSAVSPAAIAEVVKLFEPGFRKLAEAQRRDRCVFEPGLDILATLPHVQAAREVARITSLDVKLAVDRGDLDRALNDIEMMLRLIRDLQPRGYMMTELVVTAITQLVCTDINTSFLAAGALGVNQCDRLLKLLVAHESKLMDAYTEGLRGDYVSNRVTIRELTRHQDVIAAHLGVKRGESVTKSMLNMTQMGMPGGALSVPDDADAELAHLSTPRILAVVREMSRYYGSLLNLSAIPCAERVKRISSVKGPRGEDILTLIIKQSMMAPEPFATACARATAMLHASQALTALRRWQLTHSGTPADLASVIKGSPLKNVPVDSYDGKPIRLTSLDGQPVIYVVGNDGKDDHAKLDAGYDPRKPGDMLFRLPAGVKSKNKR